MQMLSDDDLNLRMMSDEELDAAWDLWFDLAQETNACDPAYSHGVLVGWAPPEGGDDKRTLTEVDSLDADRAVVLFLCADEDPHTTRVTC